MHVFAAAQRDSDPSHNLHEALCFVAAFMTLCMVLLHTFWGIVFFNGLHKKQYVQPAIVVLSHMLVSCLVSTSWFSHTCSSHVS